MDNDDRNQATDQPHALTVDPVITWLEQIRDFMGTTPPSKDMAQRAIDRLRPPAIDVWAIVGAMVDDLGTLRTNDGGALVSDRPHHPSAAADDAGYYGGYLVAESITRRNATAMSFLPQLLVAARDTPHGRAILTQLAQALSHPPHDRQIVRDRLDGCMRLARLADDFRFADGVSGELFSVSEFLKHIAGALLTGQVAAARADVEAWLDRKRDERYASRTGRATS